jgi:hypothetical protein
MNMWIAGLIGGLMLGGYILGMAFLLNYILNYFGINLPMLIRVAIILLTLVILNFKLNINYSKEV